MKKLLLLCVLALVSSCETAPKAFVPAPLTFTAPPIRVDVAEIRVVETYQSSLKPPYVEQEFPVMPSTAVKQWVAQRLVAVGASGMLEITIDDAAVQEIKLPKTEGFKGLFTNDQDARYDARIHATIRLFDGINSMSRASGDINVTRARSIAERASLDERTRMFDSMTREMMASFDREASTRMQHYFSAYLR